MQFNINILSFLPWFEGLLGIRITRVDILWRKSSLPVTLWLKLILWLSGVLDSCTQTTLSFVGSEHKI